MLIYLASPYSDKSKVVMRQREKEVSLAGAVLAYRHNVPMFLPITMSHRMKQLAPNLLGTSFEFWANIDYQAIDACQELWVLCLEGWKESIGVQHEIAYARDSLGISVKYLNPKTLRFINRPKK